MVIKNGPKVPFIVLSHFHVGGKRGYGGNVMFLVNFTPAQRSRTKPMPDNRNGLILLRDFKGLLLRDFRIVLVIKDIENDFAPVNAPCRLTLSTYKRAPSTRDLPFKAFSPESPATKAMCIAFFPAKYGIEHAPPANKMTILNKEIL